MKTKITVQLATKIKLCWNIDRTLKAIGGKTS